MLEPDKPLYLDDILAVPENGEALLVDEDHRVTHASSREERAERTREALQVANSRILGELQEKGVTEAATLASMLKAQSEQDRLDGGLLMIVFQLAQEEAGTPDEFEKRRLRTLGGVGHIVCAASALAVRTTFGETRQANASLFEHAYGEITRLNFSPATELALRTTIDDIR